MISGIVDSIVDVFYRNCLRYKFKDEFSFKTTKNNNYKQKNTVLIIDVIEKKTMSVYYMSLTLDCELFSQSKSFLFYS